MAAPQTYFVHGFTQLAGYLREAGSRRIMVLTSPSRRFTGQLEAALQGFTVDVFDGSAVHVPVEVLDAADARLAGADTVIALGGGSAIGLGKALRLRHPVLRFVAAPTTYAGSEMTSMYGITTGTAKQTGRDDRVRPDAVFYDVDLTLDLALPFTVQSLLNSAAHVISCLSTDSLAGEQRAAGIEALRTVLRAIEDLIPDPTSVAARALAQRAASSCGLAFEHGKPGIQHALAHLLGGALRVDHAPLHAMLLPHFVAHVRATKPALVRELERALSPAVRSIYTGLPIEDEHDLDCYLHDLLTRAGAPVALTALGTTATAATIDAALATRPELPAQIARDALHGLRPPGRFGRVDLGSEPHALVLGCALDDAKLIVLALHGRGAEAGTIARRYHEIIASAGGADDPRVAIVGLRSEGGLPRWYEVRYGEPGAGANAEALRAIARVETALATLSRYRVPIVLAGFSQGACLALEVGARTSHPLAAVLAPCGARLGQPAEWSPPGKASMPVLVGAAAEDKWIARADLDATIAWYRAAGANVIDISGPGDKHEITAAQRARASELVSALSSAPELKTIA
jgi:maleylacetate reductase